MADSTPKSYHTDPQLYLYTSLTSGSSHIVSATSRLQTILKANRIQFQALDVATDEKARMLWGRRAGKRKLPGLVRYGMILGDLEQIEEWNEYGEIKQNLSDGKPSASESTPSTSAVTTPSKPPPAATAPNPPDSVGSTKATAIPKSDLTPNSSEPSDPKTPNKSDPVSSLSNAMRQVGFEAAKQAGEKKQKARSDFLAATKAENPDLKKLDNSALPGMPPPTGSTNAEEAQNPDISEKPSQQKSDPVTPMAEKDEQTLEAERNATANMGSSPPPQDFLRMKKDEDTKTDIPSSTELEHKANEAIARDEADILEGKGLGSDVVKDEEQQNVQVPTAKEIEEKANQAIMDDENSHVRVQGRGSVPHALSPEPPKKGSQKSGEGDNLRDVEKEESLSPLDKDSGEKRNSDDKELSKSVSHEEQKADVTDPRLSGDSQLANEDTGGELSTTSSRQEQKVGVTTPPAEIVGKGERERDKINDGELGTTSSQQEQKAGETAPTAETVDEEEETTHEKKKGGLSKTESRQEQKVGLASQEPVPDNGSSNKTEDDVVGDSKEPKAQEKVSEKTTALTAGESQAFLGSKTQEQPAAAGDLAGESVQD